MTPEERKEYRKEYLRDWARRHPNYEKRRRQQRPLYNCWRGIKDRCLSPRNPKYARYGGRGICLYPAWASDFDAFETWINENLGPKPEGHSLDRIDNDGNYEPGNLRWASPSIQGLNRSVCHARGLPPFVTPFKKSFRVSIAGFPDISSAQRAAEAAMLIRDATLDSTSTQEES